MVLGIGLGVLTGSALRWFAPQVQRQTLNLPSWLQLAETVEEETPAQNNNKSQTNPKPVVGRFQPTREIPELSARWRTIAATQKDLQASAYMLILDDGRFAQMHADRPMPAASSIKTPVLLAALQQVDAGDLHWNESLVLTKDLVGGGAGWMASRPLGSRFPTRVAATEMIRVSDNSATNLLIDRVGGKQTINRRFQDLGLTATAVNNWLPDLDGTNTTSAHDLSRSIALVDTGEALSLRSRDLFREVMGSSVTNTLLPTGLMKGLGGAQGAPDSTLASKGYRVYNKTGDIGIAYADAGLIELPDGRRAVAGFLVKGPFNDPRSTNLIRAMAAAMAPHLKPEPAPPRRTASPSQESTP